MTYNIKNLILNESYGESYMINNTEDAEAESRLSEIMDTLEESYYQIPFGPDAVHLIKHENMYMIPYTDMAKFCKTMKIDSFTEAITKLARYYKISENSIEVAIDQEDKDDLVKIVNDVEDAIGANINVQYTTCWGEEDDEDNLEDVSLKIMYGEGCSLVCDCPGCTKDVEETNSASTVKFKNTKFIKTIAANDIKLDVSAVNVYQNDFDCYIELPDLERYMRDENINSVKEAVWNVATHNDIDVKDITLLIEKCCKSSKKKKNKKKRAAKTLETVNMIAENNLDSINLVFISNY